MRATDSSLKDISFKAIMIKTNLFLQKPSKISKLKKYPLSLEQRLDLWKNGEFEKLLFKGETIQKFLKSIKKPSKIPEISGTFKQLMQKSNINTALNLLANNMDHGILPLDQKTIAKLVLRHPQESCVSEDILINEPLEKVHSV